MPSSRRNPLDLPAAQELAELLYAQPELAAAFCRLLRQLGEQAERQAEYAWQKRKAPMAADFRACGVYARHIARTVDRPAQAGIEGGHARGMPGHTTT